MKTGRIPVVIVIFFISAIVGCNGQASTKEKLLKVIKKLEKIVASIDKKPTEVMEAAPEDTTSSSVEATPFSKDPSKTYCDEATECPTTRQCTDTDIIMAAKWRRSFPSPKIHKVCGIRISIVDDGKRSQIPDCSYGRYSAKCGNYIWCPEKEVITEKWKQGFPKEKAGNCVAVSIGSKKPEDDGLFNLKCDIAKQKYVCQGLDIYD